MNNLVKKPVMVDPEIWKELEQDAKANQRPANHHGRMIIKNHYQRKNGYRIMIKGLIDSIDEIIREMPITGKDEQLKSLIEKRERLEYAFNSVEV